MLSRNAEFNAVNRGVYIADNLDFLRALNTASVDLVCIDPPFAKNDTFTGDKLRPPYRPSRPLYPHSCETGNVDEKSTALTQRIVPATAPASPVC